MSLFYELTAEQMERRGNKVGPLLATSAVEHLWQQRHSESSQLPLQYIGIYMYMLM